MSGELTSVLAPYRGRAFQPYSDKCFCSTWAHDRFWPRVVLADRPMTTQSGLLRLLIAKIPTAGSEEIAESQPLQRSTMRIRPGQRMAIGT
ncbi:hypothetical protein D3C87_863170 [compost metagenome]